MTNEARLEQLYRDTFPVAAAVLQRMGATLEDARDTFHDAVLIYLEKSGRGTLEIHTSAKERLQNQLFYIIGKCSGHTREEIEEMFRRDRFFNSVEQRNTDW